VKLSLDGRSRTDTIGGRSERDQDGPDVEWRRVLYVYVISKRFKTSNEKEKKNY